MSNEKSGTEEMLASCTGKQALSPKELAQAWLTMLDSAVAGAR